jgi:hypothetical protein
MHTRHRGRIVALMLAIVASVGLASVPGAQAADTIIPIHWTVTAKVHLKSLNMDVAVPPGTFDGEVDLTTGSLSGSLTLPSATQKIAILGIPLASATFAMKSNGPITGHVDLATMSVSVTASFNFNITRASASLLPQLNLVGNNCHGSKPITQTLTGPINLAGANTFSSTFSIPKFADCGLLVTPLLNLIIPSDGNTFSATFAPPA